MEDYRLMVIEARKLNNKLGYNSGMVNYNQKEYEEKVRELLYKERRK